jgi:hypothetical protein
MEHYSNYKKFKQKLINKYKKDKYKLSRQKEEKDDLFISINDFLAVETSMGPQAALGEIEYQYQSNTNTYNFVYILYKIFGYKSILCKPKFELKFGEEFMVNAACLFSVDTGEITIPYKLRETLNRCKKNNDKRFIYSSLLIVEKSNPSFGHANMILIDMFNKTVERFEPHGQFSTHIMNGIDVSKVLDKLMTSKFLSITGLYDYKYISPFIMSPPIGPQMKADAYGGMCMTYSMLYLHLRLINPDLPQKKVIQYLVKMESNKLKTMILKYAKFIEDTLKKYPDIIRENNDKMVEIWNQQQEYIIASFENERIEFRRQKKLK